MAYPTASLKPPILTNTHSQGQGDLSGDGDTQVNVSAFKSRLECDIPHVDAPDCQPVQKPQFTPVIPHSSHCWALLYDSLMLSV